MYIGVRMLIQKLLRLDKNTVQELEELAQKLSETEYISFSALVRNILRKGLNNMKNNTKDFNVKIVTPTDEDLAEANIDQIPIHLQPLYKRVILKARAKDHYNDDENSF